MELEGAKRCFHFLQSKELSVDTFISDRHKGIAKWIKQTQKSQTSHFFDIWHVARSIHKKLFKASKEKGYENIKYWLNGVRNHLYWCVTSTELGFEELILAKWKCSHTLQIHTRTIPIHYSLLVPMKRSPNGGGIKQVGMTQLKSLYSSNNRPYQTH